MEEWNEHGEKIINQAGSGWRGYCSKLPFVQNISLTSIIGRLIVNRPIKNRKIILFCLTFCSNYGIVASSQRARVYLLLFDDTEDFAAAKSFFYLNIFNPELSFLKLPPDRGRFFVMHGIK